jgi:hypothetical protein
VLRQNLGHHVCCSHVIVTRGALGILVVRRRLATHTLSLPVIALTITISFGGNRVVLTYIKSAIAHEQMHRVFIRLCITPHLKIIAPQCNESSTPQIHKLSKSVRKIVLKFPHEIIFQTRNYRTLLLAFLFFVKAYFVNPCRLGLLPPISTSLSINSFPTS